MRWFDIRARHVEAIGAEDVERGMSRLPRSAPTGSPTWASGAA